MIDRLAAAAARVWALAAVAALFGPGCAHHPAPTRLMATLQGAPALVPAFDGEASNTVAVNEYALEDPVAVAALIGDIGTTPALWELAGEPGLAAQLWASGFAVYAVGHRAAASAGADFDVARFNADVGAALTAIAARHPGLPLIAVGLGLGGTALYRAAVARLVPLSAVVTLGAPLAPGGRSAAFRAVLSAPQRLGLAALSWGDLASRPLIPSTSFHGGVEQMLLSSQVPRRRMDLFYDRATAPMPASLLASLDAQPSGPVPEPTDLVAGLSRRTDLPLLIVMGFADGLAPPWQCDPATLGLRRNNIERIYLTRANGDQLEYNHLDMVLHPAADSEVYPRIMDWMEAQLE